MTTKIKPPSQLVPMLLSRGDAISVDNGRLVVEPASGLPVPEKWLHENGIALVGEILQQTRQDGLIYLSYSTGRYTHSPAGGVTLQFKHLLTGIEAYAIFNADLTRSRNTKAGQAGDPLPNGQFHLAKGTDFLKLWDKTGATRPLSDTEFYKRMGNLKAFFFTAKTHASKQDRLLSASIKPLVITADQVRNAFNMSDNSAITERQLSDNLAITASDKETLKGPQTLGLQTASTTGAICCGYKVIREKVIRENVYPINTSDKGSNKGVNNDRKFQRETRQAIEDQATTERDDWDADFDEAYFVEHGTYL
jgi:hypothetical protein